MIASRKPNKRADSVASEAIRRAWPMASTETVAKLVRASSFVEKASGTLMAEGERPSRVSLVLSGTVVGTWNAPDGRIAYVGFFGAPQFIGLTTLSGGPIATGIDALTQVTMLAWPSHEFRAIADADPALSLDLLELSIYGNQLLNHLIKLRTFTTAASRLAGLLLRYEAFCFSRDAPLVGRGNLSALAGVTPQMVSRILRKWEAAGIVRRVGASGLELLDRVALEAEAAPLEDFPAPDPTSRLASIPRM
jgi:CRP-like cAMP-binding protein